MRRAVVLLLMAVVAMGVSSVVRADTFISQNFDSDTFPDGYQFTSSTTGLGDSTTTEALWRCAAFYLPVYYPTVTTALSYSGTKSVFIKRYSDGSRQAKLQGYTTMTGTPINSGQYVASARLYRDGTGCSTLFVVANTGSASTVDPGTSLAINADGSFKARYWDGAAWQWNTLATTTPANTWLGFALEVDLDAKTMNVWYDPGTGYTKVASDLALRPSIDYNVNSMMFMPQAPTDGKTWIDDCLLRTGVFIPEPGTLALLASGLIGLLCYAWRKRR